MFWKIYFWFITLLVIAAYISEGFDDVWDVIDLIISVGAFVGLFSYAYGKRILTVQFWKFFLPSYLIWDLTNNLIIYPLKTGEPFDIFILGGFAFIIPLYIALYRYVYVFFEGEHSKENSSTTKDGKTQKEDEIEYPTILRRYLATFIDGSIIIIALFTASYLFQQNEGFSKIVRVITLSIMFLVYEPLCTSRFCTIGQRIMQIRVRSLNSYERISIISAYIRIITKVFLGIISFFSIPFTKGKRALRDFAVNSIVIYADQDKV
jgi:hypothetical protein